MNETFANDDAVNGRAITLYVPPRQLGEQVTLATPLVSVIANEFESVHEAPVAGVVKSTRTLGAGVPFELKTVARSVEAVAVTLIVTFGGGSTAP